MNFMKTFMITTTDWLTEEKTSTQVRAESELNAYRDYLKSHFGEDTSEWHSEEVERCFFKNRLDFSIEMIDQDETDYTIDFIQDGMKRHRIYDTMDEMLYEAARAVAFDDLYDLEILSIHCGDRELEYAGWCPGMVIAFSDTESGEIVWEDEFPQWDH